MPHPRQLAFDIAALPLRSQTLPPATSTNTYALGSAELLLVDPAPHRLAEQRALIDWTRSLASHNRPIKAVVLTHHHADHVGAACALVQELKLPLWAHEHTAQRLPALPFSRLLQDHDDIALGSHRWRVLHTPGHAQGHICLFNPDSRSLVLGDMLAANSSILITDHDGNMRDYIEQLQRLEELQASIALPGHGEPIERPSVHLRNARNHRLAREAAIVDALGELSPASLEDLLDRVYRKTPLWLWPLARLSLKAHLTKLESENRVRMLTENLYVA